MKPTVRYDGMIHDLACGTAWLKRRRFDRCINMWPQN